MNKYSLQLTKFFVLLIIMIEIGRFKRTCDKHLRKTLGIRLFESILSNDWFGADVNLLNIYGVYDTMDIQVPCIDFNWPFQVLTYPSHIKNGGGNVFFTTFPYVRVSLRIQLQRKSLHGETVTFEEITEIYIYMA